MRKMEVRTNLSAEEWKDAIKVLQRYFGNEDKIIEWEEKDTY